MAENAVQAVRRLAEMAARDREHIRQLGRVSGSSLQIHHALQTRPLSTIASLTVDTNLSVPTVTKAIQALESEGLVREITGRKRGRVYSYHGYLSIMNEE
jgi:Fic family protein